MRFQGQHNAFNDAIATLKALVGLAVGPKAQYSHGGIPTPAEPPILLALDVEKWFGGRTTEIGFAWLDIADLLKTDEQGRRVLAPGELGQGWHGLIGGLLYRFRPDEDQRMNSPEFVAPPAEDEPPEDQTRVVDTWEMLQEFTNFLISLGVRKPLPIGETPPMEPLVSIPDPRTAVAPDDTDLPFMTIFHQ